MKLSEDSISKTNLAMRSLFRYLEFLELNSPEFLIETEKSVLDKRFQDLNQNEIDYIKCNWEDYYLNQLVESKVIQKELSIILNHEMNNLN